MGVFCQFVTHSSTVLINNYAKGDSTTDSTPDVIEMEKLFSVAGLVAVVTGGGTGLGLYTAQALDANGAKAVYVVGRRADPLQKAAESAVNGSIIPLVGDVTDVDSLNDVVAVVEKEQGFVNVVFANAGTTGVCHDPDDNVQTGTAGQFQSKMLKPELLQEFTQILNVNTTAVFYTAMAFLELLDKGNRQGNVVQDSQIVVTTSAAAYDRSLLPTLTAYCTSKAASSGLAEILSTKFAQRSLRIRVNSLAPGHYPTEMNSAYMAMFPPYTNSRSEGAFQGARSLPREMCPAERSGSPEDIAGAVLFLASRAGAYLNGTTLLSVSISLILL